MNLNNLKNIYQSSPFFIKKLYSLIPWDIRMGRVYRSTLKFLNKSFLWREVDWKAYQENELRKLLIFCNKNVSYYTKQFREYEINVYSNDIFKEFNKIPFINKDIVTKNIHEFIPNKIENSYSATTGGTTGKPMKVIYDKSSFQAEWAYKIFFWNKALGYKASSRKATFRGVAEKNRLFFENPIYNEVRFSPFELNGIQMKMIVNKLLNYNPQYIHGYPSAVEQLANYFEKNNLRLPNLNGIMLISENIYSHQKKKIEKVFDCKIYSFYGHSERAVFASMLNDFDIYYAHPAYGVTELVREDNSLINTNEELGEIVGTGFINRAMPLIRFKTNDFSSWSDKESKINFPKLNRIKGRWTQEFLVGKNDKKVSLTSLNMHSDVFMKIKQSQYIQNKKGTVILNLVVENDFKKEDENVIINEFMKKLGNEFEIKICYVDCLQMTKAGKIKFLIQDL